MKPPDTSEIPVRYWPSPGVMFLGYLTVTPGDGQYELEFKAGPMRDGDTPRYDVRLGDKPCAESATE